MANVAVAAALAAVIAAAFAAVALAFPAAAPDVLVVVHDGDGGTHVMDLSTDGSLAVETSYGRNLIVVSGGEARIVDADCPGLDCTRQRAISEPGQQLICLPHRLWVEVVADGGTGGQMDVSAVQPASGGAAGDDAARVDAVAG